MNLPAHLRRSRHGIYYFRIVLPKALAKALAATGTAMTAGLSSRHKVPGPLVTARAFSGRTTRSVRGWAQGVVPR